MHFWSIPRQIAIVTATMLALPVAALAQIESLASPANTAGAASDGSQSEKDISSEKAVLFVPDWDALAPKQTGQTRKASQAVQTDRAELATVPVATASLRFNFRFQPWSEVLTWFADQAGYSLVLDVSPTGTFNYSDSREYTPAEAIDLLNSVLMTKGYTLVLRDRMLLLVNLEDSIPPSLVSEVPVEQLERRGVFELLSTRFQLKNLSVDDAQDEIKELLGPHGSLILLPKARQLVVVETGGRLRMIRDVLEKAELARDPSQHELRWFDLRSVAPEEVVALLRQMFEIPEGGNAMSDGSLRFATDPIGLRLLAAGRPDRLEQVAKMLTTIDQSTFAGGGDAGPQAALQIEVYTLAPADPESVFRVMQTLLADSPGARLALDPKTNNLIAMARPAEHATIRATVEQLRRDAQDVEVIRLRVVDPHLAVLAINKLFAEDGGKAPSIDADLSSRQLLIRGGIGQIAQIRSLLEKMGEPLRSDGTLSGGKLRRVPVEAADAAELIDRLQQLWPNLNENDLQVVPMGRGATSGLIDERTPVPGPPAKTELRGERPAAPMASDQDAAGEPLSPVSIPPFQTPWAATPPAPVFFAPPTPELPLPESPALPQASEEPSEVMNPSGEWPVTSVPLDELPPEETAPAPALPIPASPILVPPTPMLPVDAAPSTKSSARAGDADAPKAKPTIFAIPGPDGLFISSEDTEALDRLESLIDALIGGTTYDASKLTVFYLRHTQAAPAAERLNQLLAGSTVASTGSPAPANATGAAAKPAEGALQTSGILGAMGAAGIPGRITPSGPISITPDSRLNALLVQALPADVKLVEQLLTILDRPGSPEEVAAESKPRLIPVVHTTASEIAEVVKEVYQDRLVTAAGRASAQQMMMMQMIRRGREGGGPGGTPGMPSTVAGAGQSTETQAKMSIGVDTRTNSVVVSAPEPLFEEVRKLVETLDQAASEENQTVQVLSLRNSNPETIRDALGTILGDSVQYGNSSTRGGTRTGTMGTRGTTNSRPQVQSPYSRGTRTYQRTGQGGRR